MVGKQIDMTGERYSRLTVRGRSEKLWGSSRVLICECTCGVEVLTTRSHLLRGQAKSCGCLTKDRVIFRTIRKIQCIDRLPNDDVILECPCGNTFRRSREEFISLKIKDCGCNIPTFNSLMGQKFSRLTVIGFSGPSTQGNRWVCKCDCGKEVVANGSQLKRKNIQSCGCLLSEYASERFSRLWRETPEVMGRGRKPKE